jgi:hypothetical protein
MGYTIRLEAPDSIAAPLGAGVVAAVPDEQVPHYVMLMEDGSIHRVYNSVSGVVGIVPDDNVNGGQWPTPPIPTSEIVWWDLDRFISADGLFYGYSFRDGHWNSLPLPSVPVGASTDAVSGVKGRYGGN